MRKFIFLLILVFLLSACNPTETKQDELFLFAASSLTNAMEDIADDFEAHHPGLTVIRNYASSSQLAAQLLEGVPADVYASANEVQMGKIEADGLIENQAVIFTTNRLTIITPESNTADIKDLSDLATPGVQVVLAAPETPIRRYADQAISSLTTAQQAALYHNVVSEEPNVRQVVTKIALGEADAGIVYRSDITPDVVDKLTSITIPEDINPIALYPIAPLKSSTNASLAEAFIQFVLSPDGQHILSKWGFGPAP